MRTFPRPFSQKSRRQYRLFGAVFRGYNAFLSAWPYYHRKRREAAVWCNPDRGHWRRVERARAIRGEAEWQAYDAKMCARCACYFLGEEQTDCLAAGRPLCEEERS